MKRVNGKTVFCKTVLGRIKKINNIPVDGFSETEKKDPNSYIIDLEKGLVTSKEQLSILYEKALEEVGDDEASIFEVHLMMLEDEGFVEDIKENIKNGKSALEAVAVSKEKYSNLFSNMDDEYMQARALDIKDISDRLIRNILGTEGPDYSLDEPKIIFAYDLNPSETISMEKDKILGIITQKGSVNSHTAILARAMGIPALVNADVDFDSVGENEMCIIDGEEGVALFSPEESVINEYSSKIEKEKEHMKKLELYKEKETVSKSGKKIELYANISSPVDVDSVIKNGAEGIGLFRSEFLYLGRDKAPDEEEQFEAYKKVLLAMEGKPVIIRTLDIGADKKALYLNTSKEENPAMGARAIRLCLNRPDIFKIQLRALFKACAWGNLKVMFPMITSEEELDKIFVIVNEVKDSLEKEKASFKVPSFGIMIETPAAAIISDKLADRVDFFSIGTNDLTQYTLAMDRQADNLDNFFNPRHEAVLRLIELTVKNAHAAGIPVGICGELGADSKLLPFFLDLGVDELSMAPSKILETRKNICEA